MRKAGLTRATFFDVRIVANIRVAEIIGIELNNVRRTLRIGGLTKNRSKQQTESDTSRAQNRLNIFFCDSALR